MNPECLGGKITCRLNCRLGKASATTGAPRPAAASAGDAANAASGGGAAEEGVPGARARGSGLHGVAEEALCRGGGVSRSVSVDAPPDQPDGDVETGVGSAGLLGGAQQYSGPGGAVEEALCRTGGGGAEYEGPQLAAEVAR